MIPINKCKAKGGPSTCRYHSAYLKLEDARNNNDFDAYYQARKTLDTLDSKGYREKDSKTLVERIFKSRTLFLEEHQISAKAIPAELKEYFELKDDDMISLTKPKSVSNLTKGAYIASKTDTGWENIAWGAYSNKSISVIRDKVPTIDATTAAIICVLAYSKKVREEKAKAELNKTS